jgi:hypothetical protein
MMGKLLLGTVQVSAADVSTSIATLVFLLATAWAETTLTQLRIQLPDYYISAITGAI